MNDLFRTKPVKAIRESQFWKNSSDKVKKAGSRSIHFLPPGIGTSSLTGLYEILMFMGVRVHERWVLEEEPALSHLFPIQR